MLLEYEVPDSPRTSDPPNPDSCGIGCNGAAKTDEERAIEATANEAGRSEREVFIYIP
jgi:hypothetical protein